MATDFYSRVQLKLEAFFCPNRLCYNGFQQFMTQPTNNSTQPSGYDLSKVKYLPFMNIPISFSGAGTLADYLGFKSTGLVPSGQTVQIKNVLPFVAYHKIWNDWYRDSLLQKECFINPYQSLNTLTNAYSLPSVSFSSDSPVEVNPILADNKYLYSLRQRNFARDYFTNAKLNPQAGTPSTLAFNVVDNTGSFTIASLRAANSLQQ